MTAQNIEQALHELRHGNFDAIFADSADFLPLDRAIASQQSGLILDTIGEGICIADQAGEILWANKRMKLWPAQIQNRVCQVCRDAFMIVSSVQTSPNHGGEQRYAPVARANSRSVLT